MKEDERLSGALQENVLVLLVFDENFCNLVRNTVNSSLFESAIYRDIANHAIEFIDQFGTPIAEHLPDNLEHILNGSDKRKALAYTRVLDNLYAAKDEVNREYVISKLNAFVRQQTLKSAIVKAVEAVESGDIEQAEVELNRGLSSQIVSFERGILFSDPLDSLQFFDHTNDGIPLGIKELDDRDVIPHPGELYLLIAPAKKGKSWFLIQTGKHALIHRKKVLHITLEMSEQRVSQRYIQSFFSVSKREAKVQIPIFSFSGDGNLTGISNHILERPTLSDEGIRARLSNRLKREFRNRPPLIIKKFPTGSLTIPMLNAYLDGLERFHKFIPDVLIIDYPDLMKLDSRDVRTSTGMIFKDLRGIAGERNLACVTVTQGNRESSRAKMVTDAMVAEDYSKIATADNVITYSQTLQEKSLGLARLFVSNGRNDEDKFSMLITQSYPVGQFCLSSTMMRSHYEDLIEDLQEDRRSRRRKIDDDDD